MEIYQTKLKLLNCFDIFLKFMKYLVCGVLIFVFTLSVISVSWQIQKYFNYKFYYSDQVQKQILPISEDIKNLNSKIEKLETKVNYLENNHIETH